MLPSTLLQFPRQTDSRKLCESRLSAIYFSLPQRQVSLLSPDLCWRILPFCLQFALPDSFGHFRDSLLSESNASALIWPFTRFPSLFDHTRARVVHSCDIVPPFKSAQPSALRLHSLVTRPPHLDPPRSPFLVLNPSTNFDRHNATKTDAPATACSRHQGRAYSSRQPQHVTHRVGSILTAMRVCRKPSGSAASRQSLVDSTTPNELFISALVQSSSGKKLKRGATMLA